MKKIFTIFFTLILTFTIVINSIAQEDLPKPKYLVWEVKVNPVQLDKLLDAIETQHKFLKEMDYPYAGFVQYTNDGYFWYSTAIKDYADIDKMDAVDKELWSSNSEKTEEIQKKFEGAYSSIGSFILELQPELSILPSKQVDEPSGKRFRYFEKFYLKNGKRKAFEEASKKYVALCKKHGYTAPLYTFYPTFDKDLSVVYFIDELGDNAVDFYTKNKEKWEKFGEEGGQLWEEVKPLIERIESHLGTVDLDISYFPK